MAASWRGGGKGLWFPYTCIILFWNRQRLLANVAFVGQQLTVLSSSPVPVLGSEIASGTTTGVNFAMIRVQTIVYILCAPRDQIATTSNIPVST